MSLPSGSQPKKGFAVLSRVGVEPFSLTLDPEHSVSLSEDTSQLKTVRVSSRLARFQPK